MSHPRRVLMTATISRTLEFFLLPYATHLRAKGWRVDGMAAGVSSSTACQEGFDQVHEIGWSRNPFSPANATAGRRVRQVVADNSYDIVHVHTPVASMVTRHALRRQARPGVVYTAHGFHYGDILPGAFRALERTAGRWTDHMFVINSDDHALALEQRYVPVDRLELIAGTGLDLEHYHRDAVDDVAVAAVRTELGIGATTPLLVMLARFDPGKRHTDLLQALTMIGRDDVHIALLGADGPVEDDVRAEVDRLGLRPRVHFLGFRGDPRPFLLAADGLVLVSDREGLPRSVMEAMAMGVPIIGSRARGTRELLADGRGLLVDIGAPDQLASAIRTLLDDERSVSQMVDAAIVHAQSFDQPRLLALHEARYAEVADGLRGIPTMADARRASAAALPGVESASGQQDEVS